MKGLLNRNFKKLILRIAPHYEKFINNESGSDTDGSNAQSIHYNGTYEFMNDLCLDLEKLIWDFRPFLNNHKFCFYPGLVNISIAIRITFHWYQTSINNITIHFYFEVIDTANQYLNDFEKKVLYFKTFKHMEQWHRIIDAIDTHFMDLISLEDPAEDEETHFEEEELELPFEMIKSFQISLLTDD